MFEISEEYSTSEYEISNACIIQKIKKTIAIKYYNKKMFKYAAVL